MAYAFVQQVVGTKLQSGTNPSLSATVTAGNLLVMLVQMSSTNRNISGISGGGTWARGPAQAKSDITTFEMWYCLNTSGGAITPTLTIDFTTSTSLVLLEYSGIKTSGAVSGTPQSLGWASGASPRTTGTLTPASQPCLIVGAGHIYQPSRPISTPSGYTSRVDETGCNDSIRAFDKRVTSTSALDLTITYTGGNGTGVATLMAFEEVVVGPTITTQPTAQTARLNGDATTTATFTVAATGTGGLTYDWELETSVGGGSYANLADGNGATWTGQTSASCVGTFTAKTLSGRRVRCNVTDSNGTTTTNAVTLTVLDGPVLSASSATTNGSGVASVTSTTDDVLSVNGELYLVTATVRGQVIGRTTFRGT